MKMRVLSLLLALVMAFGLCVPAFAADEFEAEDPIVQEEEIPAAPAEPEEPEAPAEEIIAEPVAEEAIAEPAPAAAEADTVPGAAAENGTFTVVGEKSQIIAVYMYDLVAGELLSDPQEVGAVPGAEIDIILQPGYAVEEASYGYYTWFSPDMDNPPVNDEDVVPAYVSRIYVPEEGGDVTATVAEGPAMPETVPVTYEGDRAARFGNTSKAYKDEVWRNYVLFKPGYTVKISGGTVVWTAPVQNGAALEAAYIVDEGAKSVTIELVKSTGKFEIKTPEGVALEDVVNWAALIDSPDPETWATASWLGNLLEVSDIFPGMGIYLAISPEYELADLDEDLLVATGFTPLDSGEPARYYQIKTPDTGDLKLTVKAATDSIPFQLMGEKGAVHCDTDTDHTHPGSELTIYVKPGYYVQATGSVFDFLGEIDDEGCNVYRLHVLSSAESVTVTAGKAAGKLTIEGEATAFRNAWMDNEDVFMSDPIQGLAPGATVTVTVANGYAVEFEGAEDDRGPYEWIQDDPDSYYFGQLVFDYYCTAPASGGVTAKIVPGEMVAFVPVEIVDPESAITYAACAAGAVPGQQYMVELEDGYSLSVTNGEIVEAGAWVGPATDDVTVYYAVEADGKGTMTLTVTSGAEKHTVLPIHYVDVYDAIVTKDVKYALAGEHFSLAWKDGYIVVLEGAEYDLQSEMGYVPRGTEEVTVTAKRLVPGAALTIQGETDAVIPNSSDVKADIGMADDTLLVSDGDALEDGTGHILVKDGYTVSAVSDAEVVFDLLWVSDTDNMTAYYDYDVYATGENPVVKVEDGYITATVVNKAGADFRFTNMDATQMEDGTWKLYSWDLVYMIVEDGYELEVEGATYWDTVTSEATGDVVRIYALDVGAENITITVKKSASAPEKGGWKWENGAWHYYVGGEQLKDAWVTDGGKKYYVDGKGVMVNAKWKYIDGCYYSFKANGEMRRSEWLYDGAWYLLGADGEMMTGLQKVELGRPDDGLYYFNPEHDGSYGCVLTGFQGVDGATYYFNPKHDGFYGQAYTDGTYKIEGANYAFDSEGKCLGWYM